MGKKNRQHREERRGEYDLPSSAYDVAEASTDNLQEDDDDGATAHSEDGAGLRHDLYQRAVQSPKGEIRYMQKFFLMYIGGRNPLVMREDFCGTALICAEWVRADARRTAIGVDLDEDALSWGLTNNIQGIRGDASNRVHLFHQNVLHPLSKASVFKPSDSSEQMDIPESSDIVCALNFSCCCLHQRKDLISYFKRVLSSISNKGGIFVMDLYGGLSSEQSLKFKRRYNGFTYTWEQQEFDIIKRTTRISLHFQLNKSHKVLKHAFSYNWRLWTIPEIRDCLEEAGFDTTCIWMCEMQDVSGKKELEIDEEGVVYEEMNSFSQCDAWNAYIVGVKHKPGN